MKLFRFYGVIFLTMLVAIIVTSALRDHRQRQLLDAAFWLNETLLESNRRVINLAAVSAMSDREVEAWANLVRAGWTVEDFEASLPLPGTMLVSEVDTIYHKDGGRR